MRDALGLSPDSVSITGIGALQYMQKAWMQGFGLAGSVPGTCTRCQDTTERRACLALYPGPS